MHLIRRSRCLHSLFGGIQDLPNHDQNVTLEIDALRLATTRPWDWLAGRLLEESNGTDSLWFALYTNPCTSGRLLQGHVQMTCTVQPMKTSESKVYMNKGTLHVAMRPYSDENDRSCSWVMRGQLKCKSGFACIVARGYGVAGVPYRGLYILPDIWAVVRNTTECFISGSYIRNLLRNPSTYEQSKPSAI